jgi:adenosylhomocysteinase
MPMDEAAEIGDIFITATGDKNVIRGEHMKKMKDGTILCNTGHFNVEVEIPALESMATQKRVLRPDLEEYTLKDGRKIYLLGEGRLVNLACAEGHPSIVMDMSFANQAFAAMYLKRKGKNLEPKVYPVPADMDAKIAQLKLESMGVQIDTLTKEQEEYLSSWRAGT